MSEFRITFDEAVDAIAETRLLAQLNISPGLRCEQAEAVERRLKNVAPLIEDAEPGDGEEKAKRDVLVAIGEAVQTLRAFQDGPGQLAAATRHVALVIEFHDQESQALGALNAAIALGASALGDCWKEPGAISNPIVASTKWNILHGLVEHLCGKGGALEGFPSVKRQAGVVLGLLWLETAQGKAGTKPQVSQ